MLRPTLSALLAMTALAVAPPAARADDVRVFGSIEGALAIPTDAPGHRAYASGASLSGAVHLSATNFLMPLARVRVVALGAGASDLGPTTQGLTPSLSLGLRFRPRGIAHPEEPSRAGCVWAEVDAGAALWGGNVLPSFEAAVGFLFTLPGSAGVDIGPVFRFVHLLSTSQADGPVPYVVTVGLEVLINDAR
jgi:hypothetical protein